MAKYPVPPSDPKNKIRKAKPTKPKRIDFSPAVPTPLRDSKDTRTGREMPKVKKGTKGSFDDAVRTQNNQREMPKQIMGSTKAQRADYALEMMNDMRSRNILRSRKKRGM